MAVFEYNKPYVFNAAVFRLATNAEYVETYNGHTLSWYEATPKIKAEEFIRLVNAHLFEVWIDPTVLSTAPSMQKLQAELDKLKAAEIERTRRVEYTRPVNLHDEDIVQDVSGEFMYWPVNTGSHGAYNSNYLRQIADYLDAKNAPLHAYIAGGPILNTKTESE